MPSSFSFVVISPSDVGMEENGKCNKAINLPLFKGCYGITLFSHVNVRRMNEWVRKFAFGE
ncbi:CLUMA_CG014658, isoform A [Clunio marinus]|uniref:CLUMA_CG014658, isoform A n=1 Tax=Clunio marinus TaxID=568069 RepID=A0A1J1IR55_9DIPT|nr:CLUMA_CG014658, isoform A [Clunio marinus]